MHPALDPVGHCVPRAKPTCLIDTLRPHRLRPFVLVLHLHQHKSSRNLHLEYLAKDQSHNVVNHSSHQEATIHWSSNHTWSSTVDHGDASDGVFILFRGCRGRASTSSSTCGCFVRVERSSSQMISILCFLSSLWMTFQVNGSPSANDGANINLGLHHIHAQEMGDRTDVGIGQAGRPGPTEPSPFHHGSIAPSHTWSSCHFALPPFNYVILVTSSSHPR
jgi:hypothetical protein